MPNETTPEGGVFIIETPHKCQLPAEQRGLSAERRGVILYIAPKCKHLWRPRYFASSGWERVYRFVSWYWWSLLVQGKL